MRSSAGRPCLRRLARSDSRPLRLIPIVGANSLLLTKVPLSTSRVVLPLFLKPRCSFSVSKVTVRFSPGCIGEAN